MEPTQEAQAIMQVSADIRRSDLFFFSLYMLPRLKVYWIIWVGAMILYFCVLLLGDSPKDALDIAAVALASVFVATAAVAASFLLGLAYALLNANERSGNLGARVFTLRKDGFHEQTPVNKGLHRWQAISSVLVSKHYLYVGINWPLFHIVPARACKSRGEFEKFSELARELSTAGVKSA